MNSYSILNPSFADVSIYFMLYVYDSFYIYYKLTALLYYKSLLFPIKNFIEFISLNSFIYFNQLDRFINDWLFVISKISRMPYAFL
jgi:hypothetical protein